MTEQALTTMPFQHLATLGQNVDTYTHSVRQIPILSQEEEQELAIRLYEQEDLEAARQLVMSHLRFVLHIAQSYRGYGLPQADIIQEGNIGLMKAVKRFNPHVGVRLISFAVHWIRAEIHEYILRNWRIVKVATTNAQRKLFFKLRSAKQRLGWFSHDEVKAVAEDLGVTQQDVLEMEKRLSMQDTAFDGPMDDDEDSANMAPVAYIEDSRYDPAQMLEDANWDDFNQNMLGDALARLDERSLDIVRRRWLQEDDKSTLQDLAAEYSVSAERIRQIEAAAFKKLRKFMSEELVA